MHSPSGVLKFNVDGATRGKPGLVGIGGVLRNHKGEVMYMFSKHVGIKDSKEADCPYYSYFTTPCFIV